MMRIPWGIAVIAVAGLNLALLFPAMAAPSAVLLGTPFPRVARSFLHRSSLPAFRNSPPRR